MENHTNAIIMSPSVVIKSTPSESGTDLFILHEGTKVKVLDNVSGFSQVELSDGRQGWMKTADIEMI